MADKEFKPVHLNATAADLAGNNGLGRYVLLPGSDGRAKQIAEQFTNLEVKPHPRSHNLYLGQLQVGKHKIDVASISSGMGSGSIDIILNELFRLGVKRFLRVGTAGTLQPQSVHPGDIVIASSAVRDEDASRCYVPVEFPALASLEMVLAAKQAAASLKLADKTHIGIVHCKASLYGREFAKGPMSGEQENYMNIMRRAGVLASEMETSILFVLSSIFNYELAQQGEGIQHRVLSGAVLSIVGETDDFANSDVIADVEAQGVNVAINTIKELAKEELF